MNTLLPADYHLHTNHSGDSKTPMDDMIQSSIAKGLKEICFTEHMDKDFPILPEVAAGTFDLDTESYRKELFSLREKYADRITVKYGVEIGLQPQIVSDNSSYIRENDFDFVIGSIHLVDHQDPYYPYLWEGRQESDIVKRFFELTLENIKAFHDYDVLGHLDYIVRYLPSKNQVDSYALHKDIIDEILSILVKEGKGLDFNSKALFYGASRPNPQAEVLTRFREMGGRIITFGSDAHVTNGIAGCFEQARDIALACGFKEYFIFDKRNPHPHAL